MVTASKASQQFVPIEEIRDGVAVLKSKTMLAVLMVSSLNFALKSSDEQDAIIAQYQNFLNSLDFSLQFIIQSRKLDIEPYLDTLREAAKVQPVELLQIQTREYIEFVKAFVKASNIVVKSFYVVVSYIPPSIAGESAKKGIMGILGAIVPKKSEAVYIADDKFEEYKIQLWQRVDVVSAGLAQTGVKAVPLNTEELVELYYSSFNLGELEKGGLPKTI